MEMIFQLSCSTFAHATSHLLSWFRFTPWHDRRQIGIWGCTPKFFAISMWFTWCCHLAKWFLHFATDCWSCLGHVFLLFNYVAHERASSVTDGYKQPTAVANEIVGWILAVSLFLDILCSFTFQSVIIFILTIASKGDQNHSWNT